MRIARSDGKSHCPVFYFGDSCQFTKVLPDCVGEAFPDYLTMTASTPWPTIDEETRALLPQKVCVCARTHTLSPAAACCRPFGCTPQQLPAPSSRPRRKQRSVRERRAPPRDGLPR